jgi:hypothetical protein
VAEHGLLRRPHLELGGQRLHARLVGVAVHPLGQLGADRRVVLVEVAQLALDERLDLVLAEADAELVGLLLPEHELDQVAVALVGGVGEVVLAAALEGHLVALVEQPVEQLHGAGRGLVLLAGVRRVDRVVEAVDQERQLLDDDRAEPGVAQEGDGLQRLLDRRLPFRPQPPLLLDEVVLDRRLGALGGQVHEPVGHHALEPQPPRAGEVVLVDLVAVDLADLVALLRLAAQPPREPVEEVAAGHPAGEGEHDHDEHDQHGEDGLLVPPENVERVVGHLCSSLCGGRRGVRKDCGG